MPAAGGVVGAVGDVAGALGVPGVAVGGIVSGGVAGVAGLVPAGPRVVPGAHGAIPLAVSLAPMDVVAIVPDCAVVFVGSAVEGADGVVGEGEVAGTVVDGEVDTVELGELDAAAIGTHGMSTGPLMLGEPGVPGVPAGAVVPGVAGGIAEGEGVCASGLTSIMIALISATPVI